MPPPHVESDDTEVRIFVIGNGARADGELGVDDQSDKRDIHGLRAISGKVRLQSSV